MFANLSSRAGLFIIVVTSGLLLSSTVAQAQQNRGPLTPAMMGNNGGVSTSQTANGQSGYFGGSQSSFNANNYFFSQLMNSQFSFQFANVSPDDMTIVGRLASYGTVSFQFQSMLGLMINAQSTFDGTALNIDVTVSDTNFGTFGSTTASGTNLQNGRGQFDANPANGNPFGGN